MPYIIQLHNAETNSQDRPVYFCAQLHPPTREDLSPARVWHKLTTRYEGNATQFTIFEAKYAVSLANQLTSAGVNATAVYHLPWQLS